MFPNQSKASRLGRLWLLPVAALTMLLVAYAIFASTEAQAQTVAGDYCIEGIVIDWEEQPLAGITINLSADVAIPGDTSTVSAEEPGINDDDPDFLEGEFEFKGLTASPGTYTATVVLPPGYEGVTPTSLTFPIEVGEDDCVRIRFKLRPIIPVTVYKIDAAHVGLNDWLIKAVPGPGNLFAEPQMEETATINGITGTAVFTLTPGTWIFTEYAPKQDDMDEPREAYMPIVPPNGRQELTIQEEDFDDNVTVVFKNDLVVGCLLIKKTSVLPEEGLGGNGLTNTAVNQFGIGGWGFELLRQDGTVARRGVTGADGFLRFDNLPLGPYVLVEEDRPGWTQQAGSFREFDYNVDGNNCAEGQEIEFFNEQDDSGFCIEGRKIDANGHFGIANWEIKTEPLDDGGFDPDNVFTDGLGNFKVEFPTDDYRVPGGKFEVCEEEQDGWIALTPTCQKVQLPDWPGACVQLKDFVNEQVGHSKANKMWDMPEGDMSMGPAKGGNMDMGPAKGGNMDMGPSKNMDTCNTYHVVKDGEGLYDIGKMYDKSAQQMLDANPMVKNHPHQWVIVGQKICIP